MRTDKNDWSSYLLKKVIKYLNFFYHVNNMVSRSFCNGTHHIYICTHSYIYMWWMPLQNDLLSYYLSEIKKIGSINIIFHRLVTNLIFISPQKGLEAVCGEIKMNVLAISGKIIFIEPIFFII